MNKKILIGSVIAVSILVLVSFTGVVGYQTTKSSTIANASPLFNVRANRAINQENDVFSCDYVGKGKEIDISLPERNKIKELFLKAINKISKMNKNEINKLIDSLKFHQKDIEKYKNVLKNNNIDVNEIQKYKGDIDIQDNNFTYDTSLKCKIVWIIAFFGVMIEAAIGGILATLFLCLPVILGAIVMVILAIIIMILEIMFPSLGFC